MDSIQEKYRNELVKLMDENPEIVPVRKKDLHDGLKNAVMIVEKFGDKYWPIFERLEEELTVMERREKRLEKFRQKDFE